MDKKTDHLLNKSFKHLTQRSMYSSTLEIKISSAITCKNFQLRLNFVQMIKYIYVDYSNSGAEKWAYHLKWAG